jgi:hypothetical protein
VERFNLKTLNDVEVKQQYHVKISNRFTTLEKLDDNVGINRGRKSIRYKINFSVIERPGHCDLKQHKTGFNHECPK